jgi:hypothetical protein
VRSAKFLVMSRGRLLVLALSAALAAALMESSFGQENAPGRAPAKGGEAEAKNPPATAPAASRPTHPRWRPRASRGELTDEQKAEIMAFAKEYMPELYAQLKKLEKDDPRQARRLLQQLYWVYRRVQRYPAGEVRKAAVARRRVSVEIYKVRKAYGETTDKAQKAKLREQLTKLVGERFDYDQIVKEYDVKRLEKQLADLKAEIAERGRNRARTITVLVEQLLNPPTADRSPGGTDR